MQCIEHSSTLYTQQKTIQKQKKLFTRQTIECLIMRQLPSNRETQNYVIKTKILLIPLESKLTWGFRLNFTDSKKIFKSRRMSLETDNLLPEVCHDDVAVEPQLN